MRSLCDDFGVNIHVIQAVRPMSNGQAESVVKNVKSKMKLLCLENSNCFVIYGVKKREI